MSPPLRVLKMRIAIDAMGGDYAPVEQVRGAIDAAKFDNIEVILVGKKDEINRELANYNVKGLPISVVNAPDVITMDEHPAFALRKKRGASIAVAMRLVKERAVDGVVALGNTGAAMTAALIGLGRIPGIERPAIGCPLPNNNGFSLLVDAGANANCKPHHLLYFGIMGTIYMQMTVGIHNPSVGLVNIGEEPSKGSEFYVASYKMLKESNLNFIGNIEGRDVPTGKVDVIVCDGFVGNIILKFAEGMGATIFDMLKKEIKDKPIAKLGGALVKPSLKSIKTRLDPSEYGGVSLLGVDGVCVIGHGNSKAKAVRNAIRVACQSAEKDIVGMIKDYISKMNVGDGKGDK